MDETNFSDIYSEFYPKVTHYLKRLVGGNEAEDVAQVVFEKVSKSLADFKGESKISTWIFRIATNAALDRLKSPSYKHTLSGPQAPLPLQTVENIEMAFNKPISPDKKAIREEMSDCVREFVDRLPPDYRTIITLNELEGFTNKEISEILEKISHLIRERFKIWGQIQALTGEGRLSGTVLLAMPPVLMLVMIFAPNRAADQ